ncbi:NAD(P)-dependent dehydrogenase (short-subunit alcohol dehydrogenase family) [Paenibacillus sp. DS2015]|uniref:SDR family oxidoreductase n=1 Tax=Paenibacillus sp. DS2015 TaxID=3373917 RepID=UPI003D1AE04E
MPTESRKVVLLTGASGGIGQQTALMLAAQGYLVAACMRELAKAESLIEAATSLGIDLSLIHCIQLDVTNSDERTQVLDMLIHTYGRIDVLINNAGLAIAGAIEDIPLSEWHRQMETNFFGVVALTQLVLPVMRTQGKGLILNMSSVAGVIGIPIYAPYSASKFALEGFSESLRLEVHPYGIQVVILEPGVFRTPIWKKGITEAYVPSQDGPYHHQVSSILRYASQLSQSAPEPHQVARKITTILNRRSPKLRYAVGRDAQFMLWMKSILPWRWLEWIVQSVLARRQ